MVYLEKAERSVSEVTHGWMFIFRAELSQSRLCVCACVFVCHYQSESQRDVARCPHIPQSSSRGQCAQRGIRVERDTAADQKHNTRHDAMRVYTMLSISLGKETYLYIKDLIKKMLLSQ